MLIFWYIQLSIHFMSTVEKKDKLSKFVDLRSDEILVITLDHFRRLSR